MSREIKFRAWHKNLKAMMEWKSVWSEDRFMFCYKEYIADFESDDIILLQYTGLKDKNGKEIYEGDILKADSGVNGYCDFHLGRFCWTDGACHWDLVFNNRDGQPKENADEETNDTEVIGNIYKNPELLKP